jgi:endogenous inhibitor of DNA gyrase (YacG/DUF329 family)
MYFDAENYEEKKQIEHHRQNSAPVRGHEKCTFRPISSTQCRDILLKRWCTHPRPKTITLCSDKKILRE